MGINGNLPAGLKTNCIVFCEPLFIILSILLSRSAFSVEAISSLEAIITLGCIFVTLSISVMASKYYKKLEPITSLIADVVLFPDTIVARSINIYHSSSLPINTNVACQGASFREAYEQIKLNQAKTYFRTFLDTAFCEQIAIVVGSGRFPASTMPLNRQCLLNIDFSTCFYGTQHSASKLQDKTAKVDFNYPEHDHASDKFCVSYCDHTEISNLVIYR